MLEVVELPPPDDVVVLERGLDEAVDRDDDAAGLELRWAVLLRAGDVSRDRLADVVRLALVVVDEPERAEGAAPGVPGVGALDADDGAGREGAVLEVAGVEVAGVEGAGLASPWFEGDTALAALPEVSSAGTPRSTTPLATASVTLAAAATVITLRPKCTDRE